MGFEEGRIVLNSDNDTFFAGQILSGRLEFDVSSSKSYRGLYLEIKGFCKVHWTTSHTRKVGDRTEHYTESHESYEEYMNVTIYLAGDKTGDHTFNAGHHSFPFEAQIPPTCPSSFSGSNGRVQYEVKAVVDRSFQLNQTKTINFKVIAPLDLNANPYCKEPIEMEFHNSYCCWCMNAGNSETIIKVPAGGWCPKQVIPVEIACINTSSVELDIKLQIKKEVIYRAEHLPDTRYDHETVLEIEKGPIGGGTTKNYAVEVQLPDMDVINLTGCRFIDVNYTFKVKLETSGCHEDDELTRPFIIGSIPIHGGPNPAISSQNIAGVNYYPPQPIVNQPFPNTSPYPNAPAIGIVPPQNPPYPAGNMANPPYPAGNTANPPYPTPNMGNPPYPNQPFPSPNPPYPNSNVTNPPYPPNSGSPYPPNVPYPTKADSSQPYPPNFGNNSPYPPSPKAPYPPNVSPYPGVAQSQLEKTGNPGFVANDGATVPLLPVGAGVPYPTSPYASASAPVPSTPDVGNNEDPPSYNEITKNPPFNPNFK